MRSLILGLLFGVALFSAQAADRYPPTAKSTRTTVTVNIVWLENQKIVDAVCSALADSAPTGRIAGCYSEVYSTIYTVEPRSFNDNYWLVILGHEFWHALGADHPVLP